MGIDLHHGVIESCAKQLSPNQMKEVIAKIEKQLEKREEADTPIAWVEILSELKESVNKMEGAQIPLQIKSE